MKVWMLFVLLGLLAVIAWQLWFALLPGVKEPAYVVLEKKEGYEIRHYNPYITATIALSGSYSTVSNQGFRILANYIFGNNTANAAMAMTAPVLQKDAPGVKMAMAVPVIMHAGERADEQRISFVMPAEYTLETLPRPRDVRIDIEQVPARTVAVYRFTWYPSEKRVAEKKAAFAALLARDGVRTQGSMILARYNPPFIVPFLMRNELLIEVTP